MACTPVAMLICRRCSRVSLLIVCICSTLSSAFLSGPRYLDMKPVDPVLLLGSTLELTCEILPAYSGPNNDSRAICFRHNNRNACADGSNELAKVVNPRVASYTLRNVTLDHDGHFYCRLPDVDSTGQGTAYVHVLRPPLVPEIIGCTAWDRLSCQWMPSVKLQNNYTNSRSLQQALTWTQGTRTDSTQCQMKGSENRCVEADVSVGNVTVPGLDGPFCVNVSAWNGVNVTVSSKLWCTYVTDIAKPHALTKPTVRVINGTHSSINVTAPSLSVSCPVGTTFKYLLTYRTHWSQSVTTAMFDSSQFILSTIPNTRYTASVAVKPAEFGLWSDNVDLESFKTPAAAPVRSPLADSGAFKVTHGHLREVFIYWQKLNPWDQHGPGFMYVVQKSPVGAQKWTDDCSKADVSSINTWIGADAVDFTVISRNQLGETRPTTTIHVPADNSPALRYSVVSKLVAERNDSVVMVTWSSSVDNVTEFTLLWCQSQDARTCVDDILWLKVSSEARQYNISLTDSMSPHTDSSVVYIVGIAASFTDGLNSGITWAKCVYNFKADARPPNDVKVVAPTNYGGYGTLLVTWVHPPCNVREGYITLFELHYCVIDSHESCSDAFGVVEVPGDRTSYNLTDLMHGADYSVWMYSVTRAGRSVDGSNNSTAKTSASWVTPGYVFGICMGTLIFLLCALCVFWACYRKCRLCRREFMAGLRIRVPDSYTKPFTVADNADSSYVGYTETPMRNNLNNGGTGIYRPLIPKDISLATMTAGRQRQSADEEDADIRQYMNVNIPTEEAPSVSGVDAVYRPYTAPADRNSASEGSVELRIPTPVPTQQTTQIPTAAGSAPVDHATPLALMPENMDVLNGGYLVVGPDTFGCHDTVTLPTFMPAPVRAGSTSPMPVTTTTTTSPPRESSYADLSLAMGKLPTSPVIGEEVAINVDGNVDESLPNRTVAGNLTPERLPDQVTDGSVTDGINDGSPMSKYAVIVGVCVGDESTPPTMERRPSVADTVSVDPPPVEPENSLMEHPDSFPVDNIVLFSNPANNGYMSYNELLGTTAAVGMG